MKIVFVCGAGIVSGKETQTINTMTELKRQGHGVYCIMASWGTPEFGKLLRERDIPFTLMRLGFISKTLSWPAIRMTLHQAIYLPYLWWSYRRYIRSIDPAYVIHTNFHHVFLLMPVITRGFNIFYAHDPFPPSRFFKMLFRQFNKTIDLFVGVSKFIVKDLVALGLPGDKVVCVYNGVAIDVRTTVPATPGKKMLTVGIVGQIGEWKGHKVLIEAIAPLLRENNLELKIVGDGAVDAVEELQAIVKKEGLGSSVTFTGRISGLGNIYSGIDIICVPSLWPEPFGLTATEAGYFRIPVICSDVGGLPEVVENDVTGLVVPANNIKELRAALNKLVHDPAKRKAMGEAAFNRITSMFTIKRSTDELLIHLQKLPVNRRQ